MRAALATAAELKPTTAALREPTLDDIFLSLTGRPAEDDPSDGAAVATTRGAA